jgi:hypothetical protein
MPISSSRSAGAGGTAATDTLVVEGIGRAAARGSATSSSRRWRAPLMVNPCS